MERTKCNHVLVVGASGAIGRAFVDYFSKNNNCLVRAVSRSECHFLQPNVICHRLEFDSESQWQRLAMQVADCQPLDFVVVASGQLHSEQAKPEKSLADVSFEKLQTIFFINTYLPAIVGKCFLPLLAKTQKSVFVVLSARVGSITDNQLGGWYSYRASKSALNMILKTASIEMARRNKQAIVVAMHPGTVDSSLSKPFQRGLPEGQLLSAAESVEHMVLVIEGLQAKDSGGFFAWSGEVIDY